MSIRTQADLIVKAKAAGLKINTQFEAVTITRNKYRVVRIWPDKVITRYEAGIPLDLAQRINIKAAAELLQLA